MRKKTVLTELAKLTPVRFEKLCSQLNNQQLFEILTRENIDDAKRLQLFAQYQPILDMVNAPSKQEKILLCSKFVLNHSVKNKFKVDTKFFVSEVEASYAVTANLTTEEETALKQRYPALFNEFPKDAFTQKKRDWDRNPEKPIYKLQVEALCQTIVDVAKSEGVYLEREQKENRPEEILNYFTNENIERRTAKNAENVLNSIRDFTKILAIKAMRNRKLEQAIFLELQSKPDKTDYNTVFALHQTWLDLESKLDKDNIYDPSMRLNARTACEKKLSDFLLSLSKKAIYSDDFKRNARLFSKNILGGVKDAFGVFPPTKDDLECVGGTGNRIIQAKNFIEANLLSNTLNAITEDITSDLHIYESLGKGVHIHVPTIVHWALGLQEKVLAFTDPNWDVALTDLSPFEFFEMSTQINKLNEKILSFLSDMFTKFVAESFNGEGEVAPTNGLYEDWSKEPLLDFLKIELALNEENPFLDQDDFTPRLLRGFDFVIEKLLGTNLLKSKVGSNESPELKFEEIATQQDTIKRLCDPVRELRKLSKEEVTLFVNTLFSVSNFPFYFIPETANKRGYSPAFFLACMYQFGSSESNVATYFTKLKEACVNYPNLQEKLDYIVKRFHNLHNDKKAFQPDFGKAWESIYKPKLRNFIAFKQHQHKTTTKEHKEEFLKTVISELDHTEAPWYLYMELLKTNSSENEDFNEMLLTKIFKKCYKADQPDVVLDLCKKYPVIVNNIFNSPDRSNELINLSLSRDHSELVSFFLEQKFINVKDDDPLKLAIESGATKTLILLLPFYVKHNHEALIKVFAAVQTRLKNNDLKRVSIHECLNSMKKFIGESNIMNLPLCNVIFNLFKEPSLALTQRQIASVSNFLLSPQGISALDIMIENKIDLKPFKHLLPKSIMNDNPALAIKLLDALPNELILEMMGTFFKGSTLLQMAAHNGYEDIVKGLLAKGANQLFVGRGKKNQLTPVSEAANNGHTQIVELLIRDPNCTPKIKLDIIKNLQQFPSDINDITINKIRSTMTIEDFYSEIERETPHNQQPKEIVSRLKLFLDISSEEENERLAVYWLKEAEKTMVPILIEVMPVSMLDKLHITHQRHDRVAMSSTIMSYVIASPKIKNKEALIDQLLKKGCSLIDVDHIFSPLYQAVVSNKHTILSLFLNHIEADSKHNAFFKQEVPTILNLYNTGDVYVSDENMASLLKLFVDKASAQELDLIKEKESILEFFIRQQDTETVKHIIKKYSRSELPINWFSSTNTPLSKDCLVKEQFRMFKILIRTMSRKDIEAQSIPQLDKVFRLLKLINLLNGKKNYSKNKSAFIKCLNEIEPKTIFIQTVLNIERAKRKFIRPEATFSQNKTFKLFDLLYEKAKDKDRNHPELKENMVEFLDYFLTYFPINQRTISKFDINRVFEWINSTPNFSNKGLAVINFATRLNAFYQTTHYENRFLSKDLMRLVQSEVDTPAILGLIEQSTINDATDLDIAMKFINNISNKSLKTDAATLILKKASKMLSFSDFCKKAQSIHPEDSEQTSVLFFKICLDYIMERSGEYVYLLNEIIVNVLPIFKVDLRQQFVTDLIQLSAKLQYHSEVVSMIEAINKIQDSEIKLNAHCLLINAQANSINQSNYEHFLRGYEQPKLEKVSLELLHMFYGSASTFDFDYAVYNTLLTNIQTETTKQDWVVKLKKMLRNESEKQRRRQGGYDYYGYSYSDTPDW